MANTPQFNFSDSMKEIDQINEWFQQDDLDLEAALTKLKRGKELIKQCKTRLDDIENEFKELKADFADEPERDAESTLQKEASPKSSINDDDLDDLPF